jgi:hypothetical protein
MKRWFDEVGKLGLARGVSCNLDFHTIPFHGADALLENSKATPCMLNASYQAALRSFVSLVFTLCST